MARTVSIFIAALLGPFVFVAAYLVVARLANWYVGPTGDGIVQVGGVLAGVAPILMARGSLWVRGLVAAAYAIPCALASVFYSLLLNCSMFRQCLS